MAGVVLAGVVSLGAAVQLKKNVSRLRADKWVRSDVPPIDPSALNLNNDHQILSCVTAGVYARDCGNGNSISAEYFRAAGYREVTDPDILLEYDENQRVTTRSTLLRDTFIEPLVQSQICLFEVKDQERKIKDAVLNTEVGPSKFVVVFRGTIRSCRNLVDDFRIFGERLHKKSGNYEPIVKLIVGLDRMHHSQVAVVGHSLGASLALLVARGLALEHGIVVATYLFNLPNFTSDVLLKKIFIGAVNGVSDPVGLVLGNRVRGIIRKFGDLFSSTASTITRVGTQWHAAVGLENLKLESRKLQNIGFRPRVFTNERDLISNENIRVYGIPGQEVPVISTSASVWRILGFDAQSRHLVPAGFLFISDWAEGVQEAHALSQWYARDCYVRSSGFG